MDAVRSVIYFGVIAQVGGIMFLVGSAVEQFSGLQGAHELLFSAIILIFVGNIGLLSGRALRTLSERVQRLESQSLASAKI